MSHDPEQVARRLIEEGFNGGDLALADELVSPAMVEHQSSARTTQQAPRASRP